MSQENKTITKEDVQQVINVMDTQFQPQHQEVAQNLIEGFVQSEEFKKQALEGGIPEEVITVIQLLATEEADEFIHEILKELEEQEPTIDQVQEFLSHMEDEDDFSEE